MVYVPYASRESVTRTCRRSAAGWFRFLFRLLISFQACCWTHAHPVWDWKGEVVGPSRMFRSPCLTELVAGLWCQRKHDEAG